MATLVERLLAGDRRALARLISHVENERPQGLIAVNELYGKTGRARILGFTGPPGAGKSTLVDKVARALRKEGKTLGIIAVDPTSPCSGGAILGDRIRMAELCEDRDVFIRSMGTRGALGGLALATENVIHLLDAFGKDVILVETVGVGQSEVDIVKTADTSIVVEVPGLGDGIQAIKAGILEIGDIFAVNKGDRDGADRVMMEIQTMLQMSQTPMERIPPVIKTIASTGEGVDELMAAIYEHWQWLEENDKLKELRQLRRKAQFKRVLTAHMVAQFKDVMKDDEQYKELVDDVLHGKIGPYGASDVLLERFLGRLVGQKD